MKYDKCDKHRKKLTGCGFLSLKQPALIPNLNKNFLKSVNWRHIRFINLFKGEFSEKGNPFSLSFNYLGLISIERRKKLLFPFKKRHEIRMIMVPV